MSNKKIDNIAALMKNDKSRMMLIITGLVLISTFGIAAVTIGGAKRSAETKATTAVTHAPDMKAVPGLNESPKHADLVEKSNERNVEKALEAGTSAVPTLVNKPEESSGDPFDLAKKKPEPPKMAPETPPISVPEITPPKQVEAPVVLQEAPQIPVQKTEREIKREEDSAKMMASYLNSWGPSTQRVEVDLGVGANRGQAAEVPSGQQSQSQPQGVAQNGVQQEQQIIKAASILNAVMLTSLNSDEPGPVLAQIVSGPYSGARVMGSYVVGENANKATLQFQRLSWGGAQNSIAIQAFAVDPESARTGLATNVDKHYLERFGSMFATAFLSGYGQAISQSGATTTTGVGSGGATSQTQNPVLTGKEKVQVALGKVGEVAGQHLQPSMTRKPTIFVEQGTPMGLLFMNDVAIPTK